MRQADPVLHQTHVGRKYVPRKVCPKTADGKKQTADRQNECAPCLKKKCESAGFDFETSCSPARPDNYANGRCHAEGNFTAKTAEMLIMDPLSSNHAQCMVYHY